MFDILILMPLQKLILSLSMFLISIAWADTSIESPVKGTVLNIKTKKVNYTCANEGGAKVTETLTMVELKTEDGERFAVSLPQEFLSSSKLKRGGTVEIEWAKDAECKNRPPWATRIRFLKVTKKTLTQ